MDNSLLVLIIVGFMGVTALVNALFMYKLGKRMVSHNERLIKAVLAKDLMDYARVESSPEEEIEKLGKENELAVKAAEIESAQRDERSWPIS